MRFDIQKFAEESSDDDVEKKEKFVGCLQDKVESSQVKPQNGECAGMSKEEVQDLMNEET